MESMDPREAPLAPYRARDSCGCWRLHCGPGAGPSARRQRLAAPVEEDRAVTIAAPFGRTSLLAAAELFWLGLRPSGYAFQPVDTGPGVFTSPGRGPAM